MTQPAQQTEQNQQTQQQQSTETITQKLAIPLTHKNYDKDFIYEYQGVKLPLLQMTDPYYPHSKLAKSVFQGYYILFFMYSVIFMITYPLLNFLQGNDLLSITIIKLIQTNIKWDIISAVLFIFMALICTQLSQLLSTINTYILMFVIFIVFSSSGIFITKNYKMYFTDRIFIVVFNLGLCAKTLTYIKDKRKLRMYDVGTVNWGKMEKQKNINRIQTRILYLISPYPVYHKFVQQYNPKLKIHVRYLLTKFFVSGLCLLVNNILIVKFIQPACHETTLSFIALSFKLVPLAFYINMVLYYMVMDNVIAALSEITRVENRILYLDWWNAQTVYEFLDKWCLIINMATEQFLPTVNQRVKHTIHALLLQVLMLLIFGQSLSLLACIMFGFILCVVYFLGGVQQIQNNMLVHVLCMSYTPVMIALEVKHSIFSKGIF